MVEIIEKPKGRCAVVISAKSQFRRYTYPTLWGTTLTWQLWERRRSRRIGNPIIPFHLLVQPRNSSSSKLSYLEWDKARNSGNDSPYVHPVNYFVSGYLQRAVNSYRADYTDRFIALVSQSNVRNAPIAAIHILHPDEPSSRDITLFVAEESSRSNFHPVNQIFFSCFVFSITVGTRICVISQGFFQQKHCPKTV